MSRTNSPNKWRTTSAEVTTATVTPIVAEKSAVASSTRNIIVIGAPTTPAATAPIPARIKIVSSDGAQGSTRLTSSEHAAPNSVPRNSDELNMPPRKPLPIDTAEAAALAGSARSASAVHDRSNRARSCAGCRHGRCRGFAERPAPRSRAPARPAPAAPSLFSAMRRIDLLDPGDPDHDRDRQQAGKDADRREDQIMARARCRPA